MGSQHGKIPALYVVNTPSKSLLILGSDVLLATQLLPCGPLGDRPVRSLMS